MRRSRAASRGEVDGAQTHLDPYCRSKYCLHCLHCPRRQLPLLLLPRRLRRGVKWSQSCWACADVRHWHWNRCCHHRCPMLLTVQPHAQRSRQLERPQRPGSWPANRLPLTLQRQRQQCCRLSCVHCWVQRLPSYARGRGPRYRAPGDEWWLWVMQGAWRTPLPRPYRQSRRRQWLRPRQHQ